MHIRIYLSTSILHRSATPDLLSEDMARERERRKWEEEQAQELEKPVGPVHYEEMRHGGEVDITIRTRFLLLWGGGQVIQT